MYIYRHIISLYIYIYIYIEIMSINNFKICYLFIESILMIQILKNKNSKYFKEIKTKIHIFFKDHTTNINFKEIKKITKIKSNAYLFIKTTKILIKPKLYYIFFIMPH